MSVSWEQFSLVFKKNKRKDITCPCKVPLTGSTRPFPLKRGLWVALTPLRHWLAGGQGSSVATHGPHIKTTLHSICSLQINTSILSHFSTQECYVYFGIYLIASDSWKDNSFLSHFPPTRLWNSCLTLPFPPPYKPTNVYIFYYNLPYSHTVPLMARKDNSQKEHDKFLIFYSLR